MPSSYTASLRLTLEAAGENLNTWGGILNAGVFQLVDTTVAGFLTKALTGNYSLTTANGATDEARYAMINFTGTGAFTVTIPGVSKAYDIINSTTGILTITTGSGTSAAIRAGEQVRLTCDGTNVTRSQGFYFNNVRIQGVADPTGAQDAATKNYVDATAFSMASGALPGQGGSAGYYLTTNGTTASWGQITAAGIGAVGSVAPSITGGYTQSGSTKAAVTALAALDIDWSANDVQTKSISSNSTFTFSNFTASKAQSVTFFLTISSAAVPAWPASVKYGGGVNPSSTLGNGSHMITLSTPDGGTTVVLTVAAKAYA